MLLAALLLKVGTYGLIRFNLMLFPEASKYFATFVGIIAVIGIVYGAVNALIQTDIKRLVAYSSVSHLGFVVLGVFAFTQQGVTGGVLQMVNHGLATGALFLLVGMVYERTHTRDLGSMGGLASVMPWLMGAFLFTAFASAGLPGLNGFVGEFLVIVGTFAVHTWFGVARRDRGGPRGDLPPVVVPADGVRAGPRGAPLAAGREPSRGRGPRAGARAPARVRRGAEAAHRPDRPGHRGRDRARRAGPPDRCRVAARSERRPLRSTGGRP